MSSFLRIDNWLVYTISSQPDGGFIKYVTDLTPLYRAIEHMSVVIRVVQVLDKSTR